MATVIPRGKKFAVVYNYTNERGEVKQKWESGFENEKEANIRKMEIELEQATGTFINPSDITLEDFLLKRWVPLHSKKRWGPSMYTSSMGLIRNHILPHLGKRTLQSLTPLDFEELFNTLAITEKGTYKEGVRVKPPKPVDFDVNLDVAMNPSKYLSTGTINEVYDVLKPALKCAVEWKLLRESPLPTEAPKVIKKKREIWNDSTMKEAFAQIKHPLLHLAIHLAFVCSLRNGETVGITLDNIRLKDKTILIDKTIERLEWAALKAVPQKDIIQIFPNKFPNKKSCLVLKRPKTEESNRTAIITDPLGQEIFERMQQIERDKKRLGEKYHDYNLLICLENGDPVEPQLVMKWFDKWQKKAGAAFPRIVFHGIRHSATTYKMGISDGDANAVQGDGGWASLQMLDVYTRVQEASRRKLSQKLQDDFYDRPETEVKKETENISLNPFQPSKEEMENMLLDMLKDPEMKQKVLMALLAGAAQNNAS